MCPAATLPTFSHAPPPCTGARSRSRKTSSRSLPSVCDPMNFALSDEQSMLKEAATRFVREQYGFEHRRSLLGTPAGWSSEHWRAYADFGWLGLLVPEEFGGMGCSMVEANIVLEALGESIVLEPVLASAVFSATLIDRSGNDAIRASRLPLLASGDAIFA